MKRLGVNRIRKLGYYEPIVDHTVARKRAIEAFKNNGEIKDDGKSEEKAPKKVKY
jgi:hypothetical protein